MSLKLKQIHIMNFLMKNVSIQKILIGVGGLTIILLIDIFLWETGIIREGLPDLTLSHLLRSMIIGLSVFMIVWGCLRTKHEILLIEPNGKQRQIFSITGFQFLSIIILCLFFFNSYLFNVVSVEDSLLEWSSFLAWFSGCIVLLITLIKLNKDYYPKKTTRLFLFGFVVVFFILSMEEISWFQRILPLKYDESLFRRNLQGEINIHNFATNFSEVIFYFGSFLLLVVLPFICILFCNQYKSYSWYAFIPRPFIIIIGAFACAYNYDMWNIIFMQIAFWGTLIILGIILKLSHKRRDRLLALVAAIILVVSQVSFLLNGHNFIFNIYVITEYKEFLIAVSALLYAIDVSSILKNGTVKDRQST
jgi:hypothetical protein